MNLTFLFSVIRVVVTVIFFRSTLLLKFRVHHDIIYWYRKSSVRQNRVIWNYLKMTFRQGYRNTDSPVFQAISMLISSNNDKANRLKDFITRTGMATITLKPTNHTAHVDTWIDVCGVSQLSALESWSQSSQPFLSSHDLIYICQKYKHPKLDRRHIKYIAWKNTNLDAATDLVE